MHRRPVGRRSACVVAVCAALAVGAAAPSRAEPRGGAAPRVDTVLEQVRHELAESSDAMVTAAAALRRAELALPDARRAASDARTRLVAAQRREEAAAQRRGVAQTRLMLVSRDAEETAALVTEQRARIGRLARAAYQRGGSLSDVSLLLEASSPSDFTERLVALQSVVSSQRAALADLRAVEASYGTREASLEQVRDELASAHEQAQAELAAVAELAARAGAAEDQLARLASSRQAALAAAEAARGEDERRLGELRGESTRLQSLLAAQARQALGAAADRPGSTVAIQPGTLAWPVLGPVTSPFGMRVHPVTSVLKLHTGTDFGVPCGTAIRAARGGVVLAAGFNTAYGWRTVVSHGVVGGALLTTTYNHQQHLGARVGQQVRAGDVIGAVGTTGYSTGCHLHFELIVNSELVDPMPWMAAR
jgi:murein DD-endopeptidase MepM/ murein hydrolase activator NlpD